MEKTQSQILKEMKGYKKRYKKFHFGEQILKSAIIILLVIFAVAVFLRNYYDTNEIQIAVSLIKIIGIASIIFLFVIVFIEYNILTNYLIAACDTDINLKNSIKLCYKKNIEKVDSIKVVKNHLGQYKVIIEHTNLGNIYLELKEAFFYMDIY